MSWYYANQGQQSGPVEDSIFEDLVRQGVIGPATLVWREGMANWIPYSQVHATATAGSPPPPPEGSTSGTAPEGASPTAGGSSSGGSASYPGASPLGASGPGASGATRFCSQCGRAYPAEQLETYGAASVCPNCKPAYLAGLSAGMAAGAAPYGTGQPFGWHFGGFWIRFLARVIDWIILGIARAIIVLPISVILGLSAGPGSNDAAGIAAMMATIPISIALSVAYEAYFLSTRGATPGKMALGLKVVTAEGGPVSVGLAIGRYFAMYLSALTLMIGYIMAGFDSQKRALHDYICGTRVIYEK